jgi:hypothetical protein
MLLFFAAGEHLGLSGSVLWLKLVCGVVRVARFLSVAATFVDQLCGCALSVLDCVCLVGL